MEFNDTVHKRRSIRKFKTDQIEKEVIVEIIKDALIAPSAHNKQPWNYYVFTLDKKVEIENIIHEKITNKRELSMYEKIMRKCLSFLKEAPVLILVYSGEEDTAPNDLLSLGASIENMLLSATDKEIGSLWLGVITAFEEEINKYLDIKGKRLISGVVLGYKDEEPIPVFRKEFNDIVKFYWYQSKIYSIIIMLQIGGMTDEKNKNIISFISFILYGL